MLKQIQDSVNGKVAWVPERAFSKGPILLLLSIECMVEGDLHWEERAYNSLPPPVVLATDSLARLKRLRYPYQYFHFRSGTTSLGHIFLNLHFP